jgi:hypothetical protein
MIMFFRRGFVDIDQTANCKGYIMMFASIDGGANWFPNNIMPANSNPDDQRFCAGGFDRSGRLFVFWASVDPSPPYNYHNIFYSYSNNFAILTPPSPLPISSVTGDVYAPYGHILHIDDPNTVSEVLIQPWYHIDVNTGKSSLKTFISTNGGLNFQQGPKISDPSQGDFSHPSMIDLGGGDLLVLAIDRSANPYEYRQFVSHNYGSSWVMDNSVIQIDTYLPGDIPSPPFLSYINYEGIGLVICYWTHRGHGNPPPNAPTVFQIIAPAKEIAKLDGINVLSTANEWNAVIKQPVKITSPLQVNSNSGYESFFHPLNQYKGIGISFSVDSLIHSYPQVLCPDSSLIIQNLNALL